MRAGGEGEDIASDTGAVPGRPFFERRGRRARCTGGIRLAKVLVVEDQDNIRKLVKMNLERAGYDVCEAADKDAGIEMARAEQPDVIVLDVMMPAGTEGFQMVWALRNNEEAPLKDVPIVMMTGIHDHTELRFYPDSEDGTYKSGEYLPVQDFLDKPVDPARLIEAVKAQLS